MEGGENVTYLLFSPLSVTTLFREIDIKAVKITRVSQLVYSHICWGIKILSRLSIILFSWEGMLIVWAEAVVAEHISIKGFLVQGEIIIEFDTLSVVTLILIMFPSILFTSSPEFYFDLLVLYLVILFNSYFEYHINYSWGHYWFGIEQLASWGLEKPTARNQQMEK